MTPPPPPHRRPAERSLAGETIVITGASSGIGLATARELVAAGANVVLGARASERLTRFGDELGAAALAVPADVRSEEAVRGLVAAGVARFGRVDSIVLAAGIGLYGGVEDHDDTEIRRMVDTNVLGTVWGVREVLPEFRRNRGGDIVIVASVAGLRGGAHEAVYAATKFAQIGLAGAIDRQLRPEGIRVTAIAPAGTNTEFALGTGRVAGDPGLADLLAPEDVALQIVTVLRQPRRMRTTLWASWSMAEGS
ncbi:SDR family oxidoreductase [Jiangella sp. DSM 45060]|uniref:SDR family oxidoreductase n=1 Tax=Jiangella sp. DSM 45060 TaxID=1798224 RepID=UPI00087A1542|nr:SDR family oxidoreductase [Jiangella sp. DSM 45060]SDS19361.1 short chain dehydrogenase [Jiangella sp. DSM 45060]